MLSLPQLQLLVNIWRTSQHDIWSFSDTPSSLYQELVSRATNFCKAAAGSGAMPEWKVTHTSDDVYKYLALGQKLNHRNTPGVYIRSPIEADSIHSSLMSSHPILTSVRSFCIDQHWLREHRDNVFDHLSLFPAITRLDLYDVHVYPEEDPALQAVGAYIVNRAQKALVLESMGSESVWNSVRLWIDAFVEQGAVLGHDRMCYRPRYSESEDAW
jgi:hypothetical protein